MKKKLIGITSIISIIILLIILVIFIGENKKIEATQEDVYDIILFWGQSNMVGWPNTDEAMPSGFEDKETYSVESGIDIDILQNTKSTSIVNTPIKAETGYIYKYLSNSFEEITSQTNILGDGFQASDYIGTTYENSRGGLIYNPSTGKLEKFILGQSPYISIETSMNVNMIPEFCRTYYEKTGHKVIAVTGAVGGVSIQTFLPQSDANHPTYTGVQYMYEAIKENFNGAVQLANRKGYNIGGKYWVCCQGEANISDPSTSSFTGNKVEYERYFTQIKNNFKRDLGTTLGAIVETAHAIGDASLALGVRQLHNSQENLIQNNDDIILGSSFAYDYYVPDATTYYSNNFNTTKYIDSSGNKINYEIAFSRARKSVCYDYYFVGSTEKNTVHFTSAALCQMGRDTANNFVKELYSKNIGTNVEAKFDNVTGEITISSISSNIGTFNAVDFRTFIDTVCESEKVKKITFKNNVNLSQNSSTGLFRDLNNLVEIENIENLNTSNVKDFSYMFYNCNNLLSVNMNDLIISNATNMSHMFERCSKLSSINMSKWNTSKVTNMTNILEGCIALVEINTPQIYSNESIILPTEQWYNVNEINDNNIYGSFKSGTFTDTVYLKKVQTYEITYNLNGGNVSGNPNTYNSVSNITLKNPTKVGYTFNGWTGSNGTTQQTSVTINGRSQSGALTYTANWTGNKVIYTVNHWKQNITGNPDLHDSTNYTKDTENLQEIAGASITPMRKEYTGFTQPTAQTVTINGDGSTVVDYYYTRNRYQVTLTKDEGVETVEGANTYYYGQNVDINATVKENYIWVNWTGDETLEDIQNTITMPARNIEFRANTVKKASVTTQYIDINTNNELEESTSEDGYEGKDYSTIQKEIQGYQFLRVDGIATGQMSGDTIVTYYYAKNTKIEINYLDKTSNEKISNTREIVGYVGKEYEVRPIQINGYKYIEDSSNIKGEMTEEIIKITFRYLKETGVNVKYVDINTDEEISEAKSYDYIAMDEYDVTEDYKDIDLYTFIKDSGNTKGIMTNDEEDVIYYYAYNSSIIIKYYDIFTNKEIEKEELIEGYEGKEYTSNQKEIDGYKFTKVNNANGKMERESIEVNYYYTKKIKIEIQYINYNTGENIIEGKTINGLEGERYDISNEIKEINGYQYISPSIKLQGTNTSEDTIIKLYYKKNEDIVQGNGNTTSSTNGDYTVANGKIPNAGKSIMNISIIIAITIIVVTIVFYIKYKKYNYVK